MATYAITAVRVNQNTQRADMARIRLVNGKENKWAGPFIEVPVTEVVDKLMGGDEVYVIFPINGQTVLGPKLEVRVFPHGIEGIEVQNPSENIGRTIGDLPKF